MRRCQQVDVVIAARLPGISPFSDVIFCPTGGITRETASEYSALTNIACGGESWLALVDLLNKGDCTAIQKREDFWHGMVVVRQFIATIDAKRTRA